MGEIINFLITMVVMVIGGTIAFATFFTAQIEKKARLRRKSEDER